ncbi:MAG: hypothetical protein PVI57_12945 [Gemmatimonadota bacterium]|jgi:hypothetical protein
MRTPTSTLLRRRPVGGAALTALFVLGPGLSNLTAQQASESDDDEVSARIANPYDLERATALLEEARVYEASPDRSGWLEAARLYRQSAASRPLGDEEVFRSLHRAAQILHVLGHDAEAQKTLEQSAAHARLYGHIQKEAEALLGAAWIANERRDLDAMNRHLSRAWLLTYSPFLPQATRLEVRQRVLLPAVTQLKAAVVAQ